MLSSNKFHRANIILSHNPIVLTIVAAEPAKVPNVAAVTAVVTTAVGIRTSSVTASTRTVFEMGVGASGNIGAGVSAVGEIVGSGTVVGVSSGVGADSLAVGVGIGVADGVEDGVGVGVGVGDGLGLGDGGGGAGA
jgi:hypothetical protein